MWKHFVVYLKSFVSHLGLKRSSADQELVALRNNAETLCMRQVQPWQKFQCCHIGLHLPIDVGCLQSMRLKE